MPKQGKQSEKEKPRKPRGFGVFELFWNSFSACWTGERDERPWGRIGVQFSAGFPWFYGLFGLCPQMLPQYL